MLHYAALARNPFHAHHLWTFQLQLGGRLELLAVRLAERYFQNHLRRADLRSERQFELVARRETLPVQCGGFRLKAPGLDDVVLGPGKVEQVELEMPAAFIEVSNWS